jgi:Flp pilus assembly protein CpaB
MNKKRSGLLLLMIGILCGILTLVTYNKQVSMAAEFVPVVKAKEEIQPFMAVKREQVYIEEIPKGALPVNAYSKLEDVVGKHMRGIVPKDTMIVSDWITTSEKVGLASIFSTELKDPTKRVIALEGTFLIDVKNLSPGDYVDVIGTIKGKAKIANYVTANKAKVIKVSEKENAGQKGYVVLVMSMDEARMTEMVQRIGKIEFLLRPYESKDGDTNPKTLQLDIDLPEEGIPFGKEGVTMHAQ